MDPKKKEEGQRRKAVLIYDGRCPVCRRMIEWIKANEKKGSFEFLPCSEEVRKRFPSIKKALCMQAMQLILPDHKVLSGEKALPEILKRLRRFAPLAEIFKLPGSKTLSGVLYRWLAAERYHVSEVLFPGKGKKKH